MVLGISSVPAVSFHHDIDQQFAECDRRWFLSDFADRILSALRYAFGGHEEKAAIRKEDE